MVDKREVVKCLKELGDVEFQRRTWLAPGGPEVSSFSELVSQLFDDTGLGDALEREPAAFDPEAVRLLREISRTASSIDQSMSPMSLVEHPAMDRLRALAAKALARLEGPQ